jgi:mono/diheme cytochrome c family protein
MTTYNIRLKNMNKIKSIVVASLALTVGLVSCDSGDMRRTPGHIYAPDMTYSRAYDAYTSNPNFEDGQTSRKPVAGTIARGHEMPDHLTEGDTVAYKTYTTALRFTDAEVGEGKRLFNIYCGICHGTNLDGQGPLFNSGKFASMPANLKDAKYVHMPAGQIYAAIKYGKNMMGSYAAQLDIRQRWMVIAYIKKVQSENGGDAYAFGAAAPATETAAATAPAPAAPAAEEAAHH